MRNALGLRRQEGLCRAPRRAAMNAPAELSALCRNAPAKHACLVRPAQACLLEHFSPRARLARAQVSLLGSRRLSGSGCSAACRAAAHACCVVACACGGWHVGTQMDRSGPRWCRRSRGPCRAREGGEGCRQGLGFNVDAPLTHSALTPVFCDC
jgi:hypothetical protein